MLCCVLALTLEFDRDDSECCGGFSDVHLEQTEDRCPCCCTSSPFSFFLKNYPFPPPSSRLQRKLSGPPRHRSVSIRSLPPCLSLHLESVCLALCIAKKHVHLSQKSETKFTATGLPSVKEWPSALHDYVQRNFAQCRDATDNAIVEEVCACRHSSLCINFSAFCHLFPFPAFALFLSRILPNGQRETLCRRCGSCW